MTEDVNVSVAMCTFNGEEYIRSQLGSILNQSCQPAEIIICDDRSEDGTVDIIEEFEQRHPNLITLYRNQPRLGVTKNFEKAIRKCEGELVALSDQDDIWHEKKLEIGVNHLRDADAGLAYHNSTIVTESLNPVGTLWGNIGYTPSSISHRKFVVNLLEGKNHVQGATMLVHSRLKEHFIPIPEQFNHDRYISLICFLIDGYAEIDEELLKYRQHEDQDLGVPESVSLPELVIGHLNMDNEEHYHILHRTAERLRSIRSFVEDNQKLIDFSDQFIKREIINRSMFHSNRESIYNEHSTKSEVQNAFTTNVKEGWYQRYQNGFQHFIRDFLEVVFYRI